MVRSLWALLPVCVLLLAGCVSDATISSTDLQNNSYSGDYQVGGAVIHPGTFHLAAGERLTLVDAIRRCGGVKPGNSWDDGGNLDAVRLKRFVHGSVVEYTLYAAPGGLDEGMVIRPGDYIFVPKRPFTSPVPNPLPFAS